ncbi:MAG TPA: 8-oxo-dGTP diphosphatase [Candidatus Saccharimonadia bacterium]|nr:8-oxo-dGTP diphosphatase [Candidatus Saccharimonadia bacterium]
MSDKTTTLLFLKRENEVLLAMKKRGWGVGRWNGVGGKLEPNETIEQALVRECQEEIGVTPLLFSKAAEHDFVMDSEQDGQWHMCVHTYLCTEWNGEPIETEEMAPQWFSMADIPFDDMWQDDRHWLPQVLSGKLLTTRFTFDTHENMTGKQVTEVAVL